MSAPRFSIIIPTLNAARGLPRTLDSLQAQAAGLFEVWIVDGGSRDDTLAVAERYPQAQCLPAPGTGIYPAMNQGIAAAQGAFLYFLGAGDALEPDVLSRVAEQCDATGADLLYGRVFLEETGTLSHGPVDEIALTRFNISHQAIFYARPLLERFGGFDERFPLYADYAFNLRCFGDPAVQCRFVDLLIARYAGGGASSAGDARFEQERGDLIRRYLGSAAQAAYRQRQHDRAGALAAIRACAESGDRWAVFGAGSAATRALAGAELTAYRDHLLGVFDNAAEKWGQLLLGHPILQPQESALAAAGCIVIISEWREEIHAGLIELGYPGDRIHLWW